MDENLLEATRKVFTTLSLKDIQKLLFIGEKCQTSLKAHKKNWASE
jgi:hypothetical protein